MSRKLLVLDLNGTLLHRDQNRVIRLRPYLDTFTAFLFHPATRKWLDSMVWSSAQPHNVNRMINSAFQRPESDLLDVWARDKMDIEPHLYSQKTQTVKDFSKVWSTFPAHSNRSTLLLDDSLSKARLQPHNHLCIEEYLPDLPRPASTDMVQRSKPDQSLVAVVGVLDALKEASNVESWMKDNSVFRGEQLPVDGGEQSKPLWFSNPSVVSAWATAGSEALARLGIKPLATQSRPVIMRPGSGRGFRK
ncbi:hypothetical protein CYLTODRAFT_489656 [Cylindrobasidium torrendii FP15055 ss-10]|uniref:Mitochondrial import inner membrane translocase subunit TIM50 n=1 Tax=Cylindrobasidium torrendii FP15055 ss-10 TaxID=1314674 RepID=A0A0D7BDK4_9AGAR|nr:hypothetical protein CYLTODRAFT_489656 [Cylindrobasidium torrendii FP15055 ss-10]